MRLPSFVVRKSVVLAGLALHLTTYCAEVEAFAPPKTHHHHQDAMTRSAATRPAALTSSSSAFGPSSSSSSRSTTTSLQALADPSAAAAAATAVASSLSLASDTSAQPLFQVPDALMTYFLETLITASVPAALSLIVLVVAAILFKPNKSNRTRDLEDSVFGQKNPVSLLYSDLYGDQDQSLQRDSNKNKSFLARLLPGPQQQLPAQQRLPQNVGVPADQYIRLTHLNRQYESYQYSFAAATTSKAAAAASYRQVAALRAWQKALSLPNLAPATVQQLQNAERDFLKAGQPLLIELRALQTALTNQVVNQELAESLQKNHHADKNGLKKTKQNSSFLRNGPDTYPLDPSTTDSTTTASTDSQVAEDANTTNVTTSTNSAATAAAPQQKQHKAIRGESLSQITKLQRQLQELELDFVQTVVQTVGPEHAAAIRTALAGDMAVRGAGQLLTDLVDRPLKTLFAGATTTTTTASSSSTSDDSTTTTTPTTRTPGNLFVSRFPGDASASQVATLREEVTAMIGSARPGIDEALVVLQTGGGTVTGYGLAAAQLLRLKDAGLKLTICVEQVAASGGYMMACVADKIVASPFAVLGSIGVISDIPNVYKRLKEEGIEFQTITAGKFKRTLTPTKKVTPADVDKTKEDLEDILVLFRDFVAENRPQLDIDAVATGETWFGKAALERKLCDEVKTVDAVLTDYVKDGFEVYEIEYKPPIETIFGKVVPANANVANPLSSSASSDSGLIGQGVRWLVRTVAEEIKAELGSELSKVSANKPIHDRYMMMDDSADRVKSQD